MRTPNLMVAATLVLACIGCDQSVDTGAPDAGLSSGSDAATGAWLKVTYRGADHLVDLGTVPAVTLDGGATAVGLADVALAALPGTDLSTVTASFLAADGFDPASKDNCATLLPVSGELLARATLDPVTLKLAWAEELQYPGCMYVTSLAQVTLTDK